MEFFDVWPYPCLLLPTNQSENTLQLQTTCELHTYFAIIAMEGFYYVTIQYRYPMRPEYSKNRKP